MAKRAAQLLYGPVLVSIAQRNDDATNPFQLQYFIVVLGRSSLGLGVKIPCIYHVVENTCLTGLANILHAF